MSLCFCYTPSPLFPQTFLEYEPIRATTSSPASTAAVPVSLSSVSAIAASASSSLVTAPNSDASTSTLIGPITAFGSKFRSELCSTDVEKVLSIRFQSPSSRMVNSLCPIPRCKGRIIANTVASSVIMWCTQQHEVDRPIRVSGVNISGILHAWAEKIWKAMNHQSALWMLPLSFENMLEETMSCIVEILHLSMDDVQERKTATFLFQVNLMFSFANHLQLSLILFLLPFSQTLTVYDIDRIAMFASQHRFESTNCSGNYIFKSWYESATLQMLVPPMRFVLRTRLDNGISDLDIYICTALRLRLIPEEIWQMSKDFAFEEELHTRFQTAAINIQHQLSKRLAKEHLRVPTAPTPQQLQEYHQNEKLYQESIRALAEVTAECVAVDDQKRASEVAEAREQRTQALRGRPRRRMVRGSAGHVQDSAAVRLLLSDAPTLQSSADAARQAVVASHDNGRATVASSQPQPSSVSESSSSSSLTMALSSTSTSSSLLCHLDDLKFQIDELEVKLGMSRMEVISPDEPLEQLLESRSNRQSVLERRTMPVERDFSYLVLSEEILRRTNGRRSIVTYSGFPRMNGAFFKRFHFPFILGRIQTQNCIVEAPFFLRMPNERPGQL